MATNVIFDNSSSLSVVCTYPATPAAGGPVLVGDLPGIALTDEAGGGNATGYTTVQFGGQIMVVEVSVKGVDGGGNSAVAYGDVLYFTDGDTPKINKKNTGTRFGVALATVGSGSTATIRVLVGGK